MNLLISVCEDFFEPVKVMLHSAGRYNSNLQVYLIYSSLSMEKVEELEKFVETECGGKLHAILADGYFEDVPLSEQYKKPELYFRLLAPYILPQEMDRILYMDADIVVNGALDDFYNQEFDGEYFAVVRDRFEFCDVVVEQKKKLGLKEEDVYFNSGVILFQLKEFREHITLDMIMDFIEKNREKLVYFDQDILNCLAKDHKKLCDEKYNFQAYPLEELDAKWVERENIVIHYTDLPKPWDKAYNANLGYIYEEAARKAGVCRYLNA